MVAGADFIWMMVVRGRVLTFAVGLALAAALGAFFQGKRRSRLESVLHGATFIVLLGASGFALLLEDARSFQVVTIVWSVLAVGALLGAESHEVMSERIVSWCRSLRPAVLLITVFIVGATAAAATTFLRVPPSLAGIAALIPFLVIFLADLHAERGVSPDTFIAAGVGAALMSEYTIALLTLPLTFSVVGALTAIAAAALRESSLRIARGVFTLKFGLLMLGLVGGSLLVLLGSSRWS